MDPEQKVPSVNICKRLLELGITKYGSTENVWRYKNNKWVVEKSIIKHPSQKIPAPDTSELGELLPRGYGSGKCLRVKDCWCGSPEGKYLTSNTEPNARAYMCIILKEKSMESKIIQPQLN